MGIGISVVVIAVGAVLAFATNAPVSGIDVNVAGAVLMVIGFIALLYTLVWWTDAMPWRRDRTAIRAHYIERRTDGRIVSPTPIRRERITVYERRAS